jgi:Trypsin-like peptidase domain
MRMVPTKRIAAPPIPIQAIVRVGDGRGFIVGADGNRFIITAAHCIPRERRPMPHLANGVGELTCPNLIGPLKRAKRTIWGELCALSLTDDVAALCAPDDQELSELADKFEAFTATTLPVGAPPSPVPPYQWMETPGTPAWVLSLDGRWLPCTVHSGGRFLATDASAEIKGGMSGSPILNAQGEAIGLISTSSETHRWQAFSDRHPSLADCLPPWLWRAIRAK